MNSRRIPLIVGLLLALGTGVLLLNYLGRSQSPQTATGPMRSVVVAAADIPARARIRPDMLQIVQRPTTEVDSDVLSDPKDATDRMSLITIPAGSTVSSSKIAKAAALALPYRLKNGLRAVSISIDKVKGVSGLLEPGDRVDVIAIPPRVGNEMPHASTIIRGSLVLAIGSALEVASATPSPDNQNSATITLALTPQQANLIELADLNTTLRLALRSPQEPIRAYPTEPLLLGNPAPPPAAAPAPAPAPAVAAPVVAAAPPNAPVTQQVRGIPVLDGDRFVDVYKR